jgi:thioesterase domain-containing protein
MASTTASVSPALPSRIILGRDREVILFESAERGHSTSTVPETIGGMVVHALAFLGGLGLEVYDVLGFSLGSMVAQGMALGFAV